MEKKSLTTLNQIAVTTTAGNVLGPSAGAVASNITQASSVFLGLFNAVFYVIGIGLVVASILRYRDHRMNESQTPISKVIFLFLAGVLIGCFPIIINYLKAKA